MRQPLTETRSNYWKSKTIADIRFLAPDSNKHLSALSPTQSLLALAIKFRMHPLLVPCWACLVGSAVDVHGLEQAAMFLHDDNLVALTVFDAHVHKWGEKLPPSIAVLMEASGLEHAKRKKRPAAASC